MNVVTEALQHRQGWTRQVGADMVGFKAKYNIKEQSWNSNVSKDRKKFFIC